VSDADYYSAIDSDAGFREWVDRNVEPHRRLRYASVTVSLKRHGETPGDATSAQMRTLAEIALRWCHDELRVSHEQNIILLHVPVGYLHQVYKMLSEAGLATSNAGLVSDLIACPGMDYCTLATARSIPIATALSLRFKELDLERTIGDLKIKISGCINACGHHHVGHIGILGMDRGGKESYQITLGGDAGTEAALGVKTGRGFGLEEIVPAIEALLRSYLRLRSDDSERFIDAYRRLGPAPFLKALYGEEFGATSDVA
jgi:sulfite reductase (NADPH) hemoprotein beta-component